MKKEKVHVKFINNKRICSKSLSILFKIWLARYYDEAIFKLSIDGYTITFNFWVIIIRSFPVWKPQILFFLQQSHHNIYRHMHYLSINMGISALLVCKPWHWVILPMQYYYAAPTAKLNSYIAEHETLDGFEKKNSRNGIINFHE